ncbi:hypothetical protein FLA105534_03380 [Flavobacterium bizetiae]|uniref:YdhG-like domain-containing protein n=1 Tax=Flavobacterium bizetiae TaxID=2704140 RepID=A0A6J4GPZ9_9FLAO|nr:DUF1801 domain-containing protein [Flavobacterium bizetiae]CAA9201057.1 hypothetical protein FLA105534_03380 [Flavobacterium bizetiae]CAD5341274.1 hypothetical protein FLA105535_01243 [Flavobacterium bizetiae]CAD5349072.1 hypothetical protein FLA105534_03054 [Flavobacterium bizetiae]
MAKNKTTETNESIVDFIDAFVEDETKKKDAFELVKIMQEVSHFEPKMWGPSIIGFGSYHYKYASGHEGDAPLVAFSPRKAAISLYVYTAPEDRDELLAKLGKHKSSKGCIYVKKLADIDVDVLKNMIAISLENLKKLYPSN